MKKLLLMLGVTASATLVAQSAPPAAPAAGPRFEVASVKRNTSAETFMSFGMPPGGRLTLINVPVRQLIVRAYQVQPYQVLGGPSWITSDRFDITAKGEDTATPQQLNAMLQSLLAERFKLKIHKEPRQSDVYRLVKARPDGKLGDNLKPAAVDCAAARGRGPGPAPGAGPAAGPPPAARGAGPQFGPGGPQGGCMLMIAPGRFQVSGQPMSAFANSLAAQLGRPVLDETGLTGGYDLTLTFMPEAGGRGLPPGAPPPGAPELPPIDPNAPSLPTALQEQLGLKLEATKAPVEMIVIDSIDQPTED
jgi:uncharacterized protein (TIGR03435 family)